MFQPVARYLLQSCIIKLKLRFKNDSDVKRRMENL